MTEEHTQISDSPTTVDRLTAELSFNRGRKDHEPVTDSSLTYGDLRLLAKQSSMIGEAARAVEEYSCRTAVPHIATEMSTLAERLRQAAFRPEEAAGQGEVKGCHPSHKTRLSDASSYDEICVNCGATDTTGGWGALAKPCPATPRPEASDAPDIVPAAVGFWKKRAKLAEQQLEDEKKDSADALAALRAELAAVTRERDEARAANERDRTNIIKSYTALSDEFSRRSWLFTSRGSYEWDDTRYQQEFRDAIDAMRPLVERFRPIGADRTNCPETQAEVDAARIDWKSRAEAADAEVARLKDENKELVANEREACAKLIEDHTISYSNQDHHGIELRPRLDGDRMGLEYAAAIRARSLTATKGG